MMGISITHIIPFLILCIHFSHAANSSSDSGCIESERRALLEFKAGLFRGSRSTVSSWTGLDCCSWDGITCHNVTGHVQVLNLGRIYDLEQISFDSSSFPWLFNLTHLEVLNLTYAGLEGPIPNMFDKLTSLTTLDLSDNHFSSSLPPSLLNHSQLQVLKISWCNLPINMFDKLTSLIHLDMSRLSFDSATFPESVCSLTRLTHLFITNVGLQGSLPFCIGNLTSLTTLGLLGNSFSGKIPDWLGNLTYLTTLDLSDNHFSSTIPSTLGNLRNLESLYLADNQLSGELSESVFEELKSLQNLDISRNHHLVLNVISSQWIPPFQLLSIGMDSVFVGTEFPKWLQNQTNLKELFMMNTSISGAIPDSFPTTHPNLISIDLSNNFLSGSVPGFHNPSLYLLRFSGNQLNGNMPQQFCNLTSLSILSLDNNQLNGNIPQHFCNLTSLWILSLGNNQLSGNIPQHFCNLTSLWILSLGNNQLTGVIPSCLGALRSLRVLDLGNNSFFGHIPNELGSLSILAYLHLNGNKLSGKLPSWLQNAKSLITLDLGDNEMEGSIPNWIGKEWPFLAYLRLESNNFSGEIPVNLCQLPSLQILNLALNNLVGPIPPCLGNLSKMLSNESGPAYGNYSYSEALLNINKGMERKYTTILPYAKFISLSSNHLRGEIPAELMNLDELQSLNLSNNDLTGVIPESIDNLRHLESLDLSMNRLSGTIPQSLANIDSLSSLNLSLNYLAGKIPVGNHFDTLNDPSIYKGNMRLCGKLLMNSCPGDDSTTVNQANVHGIADDEFDQMSWMYAGIGPGFAVGLLAVMCSLYFKDQWRIAYFGFVDNVYNKVKVILIIKISQFWRKLN